VPGVTKLPSGGYRSLNLNLGLDEAVALRAAIIRQTADTFAPDLFLVDKEPTGFHGEVLETLALLKERGCRLVLGLRDVLDDPALLAPEWARKGAASALDLYDAIWVYGLAAIHAPLAGLAEAGLALPELAGRLAYTGYLRREAPTASGLARYPKLTREPFLLVTPGGGGDGVDLVEWVLRTYERHDVPYPALVVFGPFFPAERRAAASARIAAHPRLDALAFDAQLEVLMGRAAGVVAMGGYNTFCEILSFDRPALIVPRTRPRREQLIRAQAAAALDLVDVLAEEGTQGPSTDDLARMAARLAALPGRPRPSEGMARHGMGDILTGLDAIRARTNALFAAPQCIAAE
jgi:predicted glycosyltransferase